MCVERKRNSGRFQFQLRKAAVGEAMAYLCDPILIVWRIQIAISIADRSTDTDE